MLLPKSDRIAVFDSRTLPGSPSPSLLRNATVLPLSLYDISLRPEGVFPKVGGKGVEGYFACFSHPLEVRI